MSARNEISRELLRRLAGMRAKGDRVLSLYLDLDSAEFATAPARSSAVRSLLDEAHRAVEDGELASDDRKALRGELERAREVFSGPEFAREARGVALFCCQELDLLESVKLPRGAGSEVVVGPTPFIEPLAHLGIPGDWCVALVNRRVARILRGDRNRLVELGGVSDDVHGRHSQGGWSQARYQRSYEKDWQDHVKHAAELLLAVFKRRPFERLLVGAPTELWPQLESHLHPYVRERLAGHLEIDVENTTAEQVREVADEIMAREDAERERSALARLAEALGSNGRAAAGLDEVLAMLHERRVEVLLYEEGLTVPGVVCPRCGWMSEQGKKCPVDGTTPEQRPNVIETAVESALGQSAEVMAVRDRQAIEVHGGVAAVLRF